jgi:hypothetical protein
MVSFCETEQEWFELLTRVLCDFIPSGLTADIIYLYGQTADHQESVLRKGELQIRQNRAMRIGICALDGLVLYPGGSAWRLELINRGIDPKIIVPIEQEINSSFPPSTDLEAISLVRAAVKYGWKTIFIVSPPAHQVRAFCSTVSAMTREAADLTIYSVVGETVDWKKTMTLSQNLPIGSDYQHLRGEYGKIIRYFEKGDMISGRQILDYLNKRD